MKTPDPLVRKSTLAKELGASTVTLWRWERDGKLPKSIKIGGITGHPRSVIDAWKKEQGWPVESQEGAA